MGISTLRERIHDRWWRGPVFTLLLLCISLTIFDAHFQPRVLEVPVYDGVKPEAQAKRLILLVGDGLRKSLAYSGFDNDNEDVIMPYLNAIRKRNNAVCRTSVPDEPTESRPNHVAMLGGFPEELSNLFNGSK